MVTIITGKINSHKTTRILSHFNQLGKGDGFISKKHMVKDKVHNYELIRLSTNESMHFVINEVFYHNDFSVAHKLGPYLFSKEALLWVQETIANLVKEKIEPIYLDEIGVLELNEQGFHHALKLILDNVLSCVITVREDLINDVLNTFKISHYDILKTNEMR